MLFIYYFLNKLIILIKINVKKSKINKMTKGIIITKKGYFIKIVLNLIKTSVNLNNLYIYD